MTKSTKSDTAGETTKGPKASARPSQEADKKAHLIVPTLNLGADDEDEEDDFRPARGFTAPTSPARAAGGTAVTVPPQQGELTGEHSPSVVQPVQEQVQVSLSTADAADDTRSSTPAVDPADLDGQENPVPAGHQLEQGQSQPASSGHRLTASSDVHQSASPGQGQAMERSPGLTSWDRTGNVPAVRATGTLSGMPARRPGRRRATEPFNADQPRQRNQEAMLQLAQNAPGYASLLTVYSASQLNALSFENRNINLYGLTADQAGTQLAADKALIKTLTLQRPKLTIANYVDAALEPVLRPLDPTGIDLDAMEDERDYVHELAQKGLAYRRYILSDQESANMANYRPVCSLRADVNARLTRMMDLMESIQGIQAKPFEIVSACLAEYLASLPTERTHLVSFFEKHTVTTVH